MKHPYDERLINMTNYERCEACHHLKSQHLYEKGACRPGYVCDANCEQFKTSERQDSAEDILRDLIGSSNEPYALQSVYSRAIRYFKETCGCEMDGERAVICDSCNKFREKGVYTYTGQGEWKR